MTVKQEARGIVEAEWENIYSYDGDDLVDFLYGMFEDMTAEIVRSIWMEYWGVTNDPIMKEGYIDD